MYFFDDLEKHGNRTAFFDDHSNEISYREFAKAADKIANAVSRRCLVFSICSNTFESVAGYVAFLRSHAVPVLIQQSIAPHFLQRLLKIYRPEYVYLPSKWDAAVGKTVSNIGAYQLVKTPFPIDYSLSDPLALLLSTSGTTGSPKLVRLSYQNIASNTRSIIESIKLTPDSRPITTMPMSYSYGLSIINSHLAVGASTQLTESTLLERSFWSLMKSNRITTFGGVPYIYEMLKKLRFGKMDLPHLQYITQAGGKLNVNLRSEFASQCREKNIKMYIMYGQTEATARMAVLPWEFVQEKSESMGRVIPGGKFWLKPVDGKSVNRDSEGELVYEGENVSLGYAETRFDLSRGDDNQGVLFTGDIATCDRDGFYSVVGRKNRFVKLFGNRINLDEVETLLQKGGYECACIGDDDSLTLYITTDTEQKYLEAQVWKLTGLNPQSVTCVKVRKLPRNEAGKIQYSVLEESAE